MQTEPPPSREIRSLTGIRGLVACYVMVFHFSGDASTGLAHRFILHGYLSVDLFFILSGFVLGMTYAYRFRQAVTGGGYFDFLQKRFARVYPLFFAVTLISAVLIWQHWMLGARLTPLVLVSNFLLFQGWGPAPSICGPTWSISTEFGAYLLFPFLGDRIVFGRTLWRWFALLAGAALIILVATRTPVQAHQALADKGMLNVNASGTLYPLLRCIGGFLMGLAGYAFVRPRPISARVAGVLTDVLAVALLGLILVQRADVAIVLLCVPFVALLSFDKGITARIASTGAVHWLGLISYSIYVDHFFLHESLGEPIRHMLAAAHAPHAPVVRGVLLILLSILTAAATYYGVENPARQWLRRRHPVVPNHNAAVAVS